jgi:DNA polymerase-1
MAEAQAYEYVTSAEGARRWLSEAEGAPIAAVDTETTGWDPYTARLVLVQVSAGPQLPVLVLDARRVDVRVLEPLLADTATLKVFHHGGFDLRFLALAGVRVRRVADSMLAQQLLDAGGPSGGVGLAELAEFRLGMRLDKRLRGHFSGRGGHNEPGELDDRALRYAADDAVATWGVFDQQWRELDARGLTDVARLEFAALPTLADLQLRGVAFDPHRWQRLLGELEQELPGLAEAVQAQLVTDDSPRDLFGTVPVNLDSPEQVLAALARLGIELDSTREAKLADHRAHPAVQALLDYREVAKATSNWGGDWARQVVHPVTGRVHPDWRQIVGTGRIACSEPNVTQVPKDPRYRACFGGAPGRQLVVADYSQQELRILAAVSGDERLKAVFARGGDLHRATAATTFEIPEQAVSAAQRAAAKALNFGLMYGMGAPRFAQATGLGHAEAKAAMERYFAAFPKVATWLAEAESTARRTGAMRTPLGRLRVLAGDGAGAHTLARNAPVQGAGADMTKLALAEVDRRLAARFGDLTEQVHAAPGWPPPGLVLVVHDELVVEVPDEEAHAVAGLVADGMEAAAGQVLGDAPAAVDVDVRARWSSAPPPSRVGGTDG